MTTNQNTDSLKASQQRFSYVNSAYGVLIIIIAIATLLRIVSALFQGNEIEALPGIHDQISYDALARRIIGGYGFSFGENHWPATRANEPTAHWSYLYTLYLSAIYMVSDTTPLVARLVQAIVVGVAHCWLVWRIGRRIFGTPTGLVAAGLSAVYAYFVYYAGALLTEPFYFVGILWTFDVALRLTGGAEQPGSTRVSQDSSFFNRRLWLELGIAVGLTVLLRQLFLLFFPVLVMWIVWCFYQEERQRHSIGFWTTWRSLVLRGAVWQGLLITTVLIVFMIAPWTYRNYRAFDMFVPLNTNVGYAFFWGNHPVYGTRFIGILPAEGPSYQSLIPAHLLTLNEAELDRALLREGIGFVVADPLRYALLSLSRVREYFKFWPSTDSSFNSNLARVASFGLMMPLMLSGLIMSFAEFRQSGNRRRRAAIILLFLFAGVYTVIHLLTWTLIRYRLPVDSVMLIFAAYAVTKIAHRNRQLSQLLSPQA